MRISTNPRVWPHGPVDAMTWRWVEGFKLTPTLSTNRRRLHTQLGSRDPSTRRRGKVRVERTQVFISMEDPNKMPGSYCWKHNGWWILLLLATSLRQGSHAAWDSSKIGWFTNHRTTRRGRKFQRLAHVAATNLWSMEDCLQKRESIKFVDASWYHKGERHGRTE